MVSSDKSPYYLKVSKGLMSLLNIAGVEPDEAMYFFTEQVENMINTEPNFRKGRRRSKSKNDKQLWDTWIMRGYVPGTTIPFKISLMRADHEPLSFLNVDYFAKIRLITTGAHYDELKFDGRALRARYLERKFETELLGEAHHQDSLVKAKFTKPKCMAPKGAPLHRLDKKGRRA